MVIPAIAEPGFSRNRGLSILRQATADGKAHPIAEAMGYRLEIDRRAPCCHLSRLLPCGRVSLFARLRWHRLKSARLPAILWYGSLPAVMDHRDHVALIRNGVSEPGTWADLGAGDGAFTLALAECLGPAGIIYAVDKQGRSLRSLEKSLRRTFPEVTLAAREADFTEPLPFLPALDGMLMANSLHFIRDREKPGLLACLRAYLKPDGRFILVEYDTDRGNHWVPYPLSYSTWTAVAAKAGFAQTDLLATRPSRFLGGFFAALSR